MDIFQAAVLALLQGLTEFLPVSSSAHLILVPLLTGWEDQGLAFDVMVHFGTLSAVVIYFRHELMAMFLAWIESIKTRCLNDDAKLAWFVILGTIPLGLAGLLFHDLVSTELRSPLVIASTTIGFGLLLWWADATARPLRCEYRMRVRDVVVIALAQAIAIIPGTSRSGITITAGLMMGLDRKAAARFSFLLSIPSILMAAGYEGSKLLGAEVPVDWQILAVGALLSAISAYLCIHMFLKLLDTIGMLPFVVYRLLLGVFLFWMFWP